MNDWIKMGGMLLVIFLILWIFMLFDPNKGWTVEKLCNRQISLDSQSLENGEACGGSFNKCSIVNIKGVNADVQRCLCPVNNKVSYVVCNWRTTGRGFEKYLKARSEEDFITEPEILSQLNWDPNSGWGEEE